MNVRLFALAGVVTGAVALPLAVASAGPTGPTEEGRSVVRSSLHGDGHAADSSASSASSASSTSSGSSGSSGGGEKAPSTDPARSPLLLGLGLVTAARCGPELTSPDGIEAQTCVLTQGEDTWARTYYRNATGGDLDAALSVMAPGGRTVQMNCAVGAEDEPGTCETPRERTQGALDGYAAVAEFADRSGRGPLLLRSGSDAKSDAGSDTGSNNGSDAESNSGLKTGS